MGIKTLLMQHLGSAPHISILHNNIHGHGIPPPTLELLPDFYCPYACLIMTKGF
jgi:hypothetical protein